MPRGEFRRKGNPVSGVSDAKSVVCKSRNKRQMSLLPIRVHTSINIDRDFLNFFCYFYGVFNVCRC